MSTKMNRRAERAAHRLKYTRELNEIHEGWADNHAGVTDTRRKRENILNNTGIDKLELRQEINYHIRTTSQNQNPMKNRLSPVRLALTVVVSTLMCFVLLYTSCLCSFPVHFHCCAVPQFIEPLSY